MKNLITPKKGVTCPALTKENYKYHLSGDAAEFCICTLNDLACKGRVIADPDDQSNRFFSKGKCMIDKEKIKTCPMFGCTAKTFKNVLKDKMQKEMEDKLKKIKSNGL